ncbi:hypothetical protein [Pectobacterium wasabiae]|nr:hypothetical protein [Pectobacterium wasabiae]EJS95137.1 Hypothetical protein Y17_1347 [Pectobacterium wasabiae CFBP 3304]
MKKLVFAWTTALLLSGCVLAKHADTLPDDVKIFLDNADTCQHFAGEWDSSLSEERQKEIERSVDQYCGTAQKQQSVLQKKYKGNKTIEKKLAAYQF